MITRRTFIEIAAGPCLANAARVRAQPAAAMRRIGVLDFIALSEVAPPPGPLELGLRDLGWVEGQNLVIERRYAASNRELIAAQAVELVKLGVEVIVAMGGVARIAAIAATKTLPIVALLQGGDPVAAGFAFSLARPGGNVTGNTLMSTELTVKRVQLLKEILPKLARVGEFVDLTSQAADITFRRKLRDPVYESLGMEAVYAEVANAEDIEKAFAEFNRRGVAAVMLERNLTIFRHIDRIVTAAIASRMATMAAQKGFVVAGALMSYAPSLETLVREGARFVDRILKGARPGDLPFEQPTRIECAINLKTAKAIGLTVPHSVLSARRTGS